MLRWIELGVLVVVAAGGLTAVGVLVKQVQLEFSARDEPTAVEAFVARMLRTLSVSAYARSAANPVDPTDAVLTDARAHFADHCATCHANDGSGKRQGRSMMSYKLSVGIAVGVMLALTSCVAPVRQPPPPTEFTSNDVGGHLAEVRTTTGLPESPSLEDYLRYAGLHNRGLRAAYYDWVAAAKKIPQAEALPDPRLSYANYFQEVETRVGAQRNRIGIAQMFPWVGKRALRGDIAAAAAEEKRELFEAAKLRVFYRVTDAYAEYYYVARATEITRENIDLLTFWERLSQAKYRVGTGRHPDVIKVQVELGKLVDQQRTLEELQGPLVARLNAALNRAPTTPLPWPTILEPVPASVEDRLLSSELASTNPELRSLDAAVLREEHAITLARKEFYPDVTLGLDWVETQSMPVADLSDNGKDPLIGSVSVNLPVWWEKYGSGVEEAQARARAAKDRRVDRQNELSSDRALALYKFRDAERKVDLYGDGLVPKANESLAATFTAYESGEADFLDVLDAQRVLLDFRLSHERALAARAQRLAELEMLIGQPARTATFPESGLKEDKK